ncbi:DUF2851 family protein [Shivajiella indica]|uniref:DUF2851 family protein n=1 Tax=Shivajiella indica TaxID=872115 RepID=A0ABW5BBV1_9BACT
MDFQENFLHAVWKYQYFDKTNLQTTNGDPIEIKKIGFHNLHEGPDFLESHIRIYNIDYFGHVEIHRKASEWMTHEHHKDERYNSVILHVVYDEDRAITHKDGTIIPTLELKGKIHLEVLRNFEKLSDGKDEILCGSRIMEIPSIIRFSMLEKSLIERLEAKSAIIDRILKSTKNDWEETSYRWLFLCCGFKTNGDSMLKLAESIPLKTLKKHSERIPSLEALLFGQAGLLPESSLDEFSIYLKKEYDFYQKKYLLKQLVKFEDWKMMGVRPQNFPYQRISQLAMILHKEPNLFASILKYGQTFNQILPIFQIERSNYWQYHYRLGVKAPRKISKNLSKDTINLLLINFVTPLWYGYGKYIQDDTWKEKALDLLQEIGSENNFIIRKFILHGWQAGNAFDSQGMIGLYQEYCKRKKCLDCKIGQNLLKPKKK